ncbi:hypothetical protein BH24ACT7_BH24ACT7_22940 [soil metagenome]
MDALPKRLHEAAKQTIHDIYLPETRAEAIDAVRSFADRFADLPKAVTKITAEFDTLLTFYDFPHEHWKHLRSTNAIVDVRHRQAQNQGHQGRRQPQGGPGHGLQARRRCPSPVATPRRPPPRSPRPSRSRLHRPAATRKETHRPTRPRGRHRLTRTPSTRFANISAEGRFCLYRSSGQTDRSHAPNLSGWATRRCPDPPPGRACQTSPSSSRGSPTVRSAPLPTSTGSVTPTVWRSLAGSWCGASGRGGVPGGGCRPSTRLLKVLVRRRAIDSVRREERNRQLTPGGGTAVRDPADRIVTRDEAEVVLEAVTELDEPLRSMASSPIGGWRRSWTFPRARRRGGSPRPCPTGAAAERERRPCR